MPPLPVPSGLLDAIFDPPTNLLDALVLVGLLLGTLGVLAMAGVGLAWAWGEWRGR